MQKKSISMRKLNLRVLNAENCVKLAFYAAIPREKTFAPKKAAVKRASGSRRRQWPTKPKADNKANEGRCNATVVP